MFACCRREDGEQGVVKNFVVERKAVEGSSAITKGSGIGFDSQTSRVMNTEEDAK